jgi:ankyrin repeat protein
MAAEAGVADDNDPSCVLRAVKAGSTAEQVRQVIESYASAGGARTRRSHEARRKAAVDFEDDDGETSLAAAHRAARGDLVGVLLENGADPKTLSPECRALALAIQYGLTNTLRALLRDKREDVHAPIHYSPFATDEGNPSRSCSAAHLCVVPPRRIYWVAALPPQLECLEVLVREFGADINAPDDCCRAPLHWLAFAAPEHRARAAEALLSLGADARRRDRSGRSPVFEAAWSCEAGVVRALLRHGGSADVKEQAGFTSLMAACLKSDEHPAGFPATLAVLLAASSLETRRARDYNNNRSALDLLISFRQPPYPSWKQQAIADLLAAGVPVLPSNARLVLPIAARLGERRWREVRRRERSAGTTWQEHDETVQLAFDFKELREAEEGVRARERRVEELEEELRRRGGEGEGDDEESG